MIIENSRITIIKLAISDYCQAYRCNPFSAGIVFIRHNPTSPRRIMTYKDDPRAERIKISLMVVDAKQRYSNEAEKAN